MACRSTITSAESGCQMDHSRHLRGKMNLQLSSKSYDLILYISNLLTPDFDPTPGRLSMQCLSKRCKGTATYSISPSRSTPTSLRHFGLGSCDLAQQNPEPRISQIGSTASASTIPLDTCSPKASISPRVGERTSKSFMASHGHPASNRPSLRIEIFQVGWPHCIRRKCFNFRQSLLPASCGRCP